MEKSSGKSDEIKVTNDKGRLSKEDIERMVSDAEKFKDEDNKAKENIDSRNNYENIVYQMKSTLGEEKKSTTLDDTLKTELTCDKRRI